MCCVEILSDKLLNKFFYSTLAMRKKRDKHKNSARENICAFVLPHLVMLAAVLLCCLYTKKHLDKGSIGVSNVWTCPFDVNF